MKSTQCRSGRVRRTPLGALSPVLASVFFVFFLEQPLFSEPAHESDTASTNAVKNASTSRRDLTALSIDELMTIPVSTVSRTPQSFSQSAAAISVLTQEDIRRSGATSIPEVLRMVPGLDVAQVDSHGWAISSRGFNTTFANKLLVMIDGRSVYTPLFSGVFWDAQDTVMEDIERIEVIRGPGASLWGANAVNGVINIITKSARETQGMLASAGVGTEERGFATFRYGDKINDNTFFRVYGKYFNRDQSALPGGGDAGDGWQMGRGGFRLDWQPADPNLFTLQGDAYWGELDHILRRLTPAPPYGFYYQPETFDIRGGNILGRWTHTISDESNFSLQAYYDRTYRDSVIFREDRDTYDLDFQHRFPIGQRQVFLWGAGYRNTGDSVRNSFDLSLHPGERRLQLFSAFAQDEITLVESNLVFTIGTKLEHNDFTGFEVQPSARIIWTPHEKHSIWGSVSRAVRTPSRVEDDGRLNLQPGPMPGTLVSLFGDRSFESEELTAYELGYRVQINKRLSLDVATFYNDYDRLRGLRSEPPYLETTPSPHLVMPFFVANNLKGETYGVELSANWQMAENWRWIANYSYLQLNIHTVGAPDRATEQDLEGSSPHHQASLTSRMDLPLRLQLDATVRYVDALPAIQVNSYVTMDVRLGWQATANLEFSIVGQNLLQARHAEFKPTLIATQTTEVQRGVYGKVTWRF